MTSHSESLSKKEKKDGGTGMFFYIRRISFFIHADKMWQIGELKN
jgi:hypothetical protein